MQSTETVTLIYICLVMIPISVVPIHRPVHHKEMKAEQTAFLRPERSKCAPVLSVRESVVTFHWCSV